MRATALKQARLEFKTTEDMKELITRAAALMGIDVTAFVLGPAAERANEVVANFATIQLSLEGQRRFAELLKNPHLPTEAMQKLGELPDLEIRRE